MGGVKPVKMPKRTSDPPEVGDSSLLPRTDLQWLAGGFIVFCGSCGCRLAPVPIGQQPTECCRCDLTQRYLPACMVDNRVGTPRERSRYLVWDSEAENIVMDADGTLLFFARPEEAKSTARTMSKKS